MTGSGLPPSGPLVDALVDHLGDAVVVFETEEGPSDLRVAYVNEAFTRMSGWALDDVRGRQPGTLLAPETDADAVRRMLVAAAGGSDARETLVLQAKDGHRVEAEVTAFGVRDGDDRQFWCGLFTDVTDRRQEQQRFRALIENVTDIVAVVDPELRIRYVSPAIRHMLGYEPDEVIGRPAFEVIELEESDRYAELFEGLESGVVVPRAVEVGARHKDGTERRLEVSVNDRRLDPAVGGVVVTVRDVTERAEAAVRLRRSEEWAHALLQGAADVVLVADAQGVVYYASPGIEDMLGISPEDLVGSSAFELVTLDERDRLDSDWRDLLADDENYLPASFTLRRADGGLLHTDVRARNMLRDPAVRGVVVHIRDVTERAEAQERLRRSEEWAQALVRGGSDIVTVIDRAGEFLYVGPAATSVMGHLPEDLLGTDAFDLVHPDDLERARGLLADELAGRGSVSPSRLRIRHHDGTWLQMSLLFSDMLDVPAVGGIVINARDITQRWEAEQLLARQAQALEAVARGAPLDTTLYRVAQMIEERVSGSACAVGVSSSDGAVRVRAAPALARDIVVALDGALPEGRLGRALRATTALVVFDDLGADDRWSEVVDQAPSLDDRGCWSQLIVRPGTDEVLGGLLVFTARGRRPTPAEQEIVDRLMHLAAIAIERRNFEAALEHQALHDDLTDLPNRTLLLDRIAQALERARRHQSQVAVLFIDIDRFKVINDSLGHAVGDQLLSEVAERLSRPLRLGDTLGRLGGDEFLAVCERIESQEAAEDVADRLAESMAAPFALGGAELFVTASIGIAVSGEKAVSAEALVRNADMAMYRAKDQGRARYSVFEEDLALRALERHELEQALRGALDAEQFELYYQPFIRLSDGAVTGAEALVRWNRPGRGVVDPASFVPVAEETGLILPLGRWVIEEACRQNAAWPLLPTGSPLQMTINLSARQLADPFLIDFITENLERHGLEPGRVCFEITESVLVDDIESAIATLEQLKALGVLIAIDDFGTGYATLEYLRRFHMADYLKIDRSFVEGVDTGGSKETAIVAGAISLAKSLDFTVVAEGVQTEGQVSALRGLGCDLAQGYYFSRPLPADAAVALLQRDPDWS